MAKPEDTPTGRWHSPLVPLMQIIRRWRWSLFVRPRKSTVERIVARKAQQARTGRLYVEHPSISVIVQSFNQVRNIPELEHRLRQTCVEELIVCEDGSLDGSTEEWLRRLRGPNDFLLHSNDIHEIRAYNRAIDYARGEVICLMQDDDLPPRGGAWLKSALQLFARYSDLAVLGGWCGFDDYFDTEYNAPWLPTGLRTIPTRDPFTRLPLRFVENVNIGPYLLRKDVFVRLGGFDQRFSPPGEPGITFESEFCYRAWTHGFKVALTDLPVKRHTGTQSYILPGGTTMWGNQARERNERANKQLIEQIYGEALPSIQAAVRFANEPLVSIA
jgi:Glycosyl transferase family 2